MRNARTMVSVGLSGVALVASLIASGCETTHYMAPTTPTPKEVTVSYVRGLCNLTEEQRDPTVRQLNEALLPNHAAIFCGRGGDY
jgi:hypothetical protein